MSLTHLLKVIFNRAHKARPNALNTRHLQQDDSERLKIKGWKGAPGKRKQ